MSRKRTQNQSRIYRFAYASAAGPGAGRHKFNDVLIDLKTVIETLAGQGEEAKISKALLNVQLSEADVVGNYPQSFVADIVAMVSDQSIAQTDPGENSYQGYLDDDLDVMTAGDYECKKIRTLFSKMNVVSDGTLHMQEIAQGNIDVTSVVQKASTLLSRSALLSTNPYVIIGVSGVCTNTNPTIGVSAILQVETVIRQKPLRMLA